jgi:hypothetical protein
MSRWRNIFLSIYAMCPPAGYFGTELVLNVRIAGIYSLQSRHYKQVAPKVFMINNLWVDFGWQVGNFGGNAK